MASKVSRGPCVVCGAGKDKAGAMVVARGFLWWCLSGQVFVCLFALFHLSLGREASASAADSN